ncbi:MAG: M20/M25/M40 family metallo-hydrolase [Candidatus Puniceispirillum sp.]
MDVTKLDFNAEAMLEGLKPWVLCESPSYDAAAVNRMQDIAAHDLAVMGATIERISPHPLAGDCIRARFPHPDADKPGILILGHMDTVHPIGTLAKLPFQRDGNLCYGPGIADMKGGNYLSLEAIRQLSAAGQQTPLPITVLFTSDEEIGSPYTRDLIEAEARRAVAVLVPEPARRGNGVASGRYAVARYHITTYGRPSHAGLRLSEGRSAIRKMAENIIAIEAMSGDDCTFSVGVFHAGQWVNCVSSEARAEVLSMSKQQADLDAGIQKMLALNDPQAEVATKVTLGLTRPVWAATPATMKLVAMAEMLATSLGQPFRHESSGGGSDGNFPGAMGIPTLDGLGVAGDKFHTLEEHIDIESLAMRGRMMAGLLMQIDASL